MTIKMGIPNKGRLYERSVELLIKSGIDLGEDWGRSLCITAKAQDIEVMFVRAADIPTFINAGAIDFGITGDDLVAESGYKLRKLSNLEFGACHLAVAAPESSGIRKAEDIPDGTRIATSFPNMTKRFFDKLGKKVKIVEIGGAAEIMPYLGVSDMISDLVATGSTLKMNRLVEVCRILDSQAAVFSKEKMDPAVAAKVNDVVESMKSVIDAEDKKYLMANVPRAKLRDVEKLMPGIGGPTVMELSGNPDMVAVQAVISGREMFNVINSLKKLGATGILTIAMDRLVE